MMKNIIVKFGFQLRKNNNIRDMRVAILINYSHLCYYSSQRKKVRRIILKEKIADALIKLLETKTLDKITIKEIVEICNTSRQTFYYYFKDIYDIVEWIFLEKSTLILKEKFQNS